MKGFVLHFPIRYGLLTMWLALAAVLFCACPGPDYREVPVPPVQCPIHPYGSDNDLLPVGGYVIRENYGYGGIIVYHFTESEYLAYDLACPNDYEHGCKVTYHPESLTLICEGCPICTDCGTGCKTVYSILTGFPEDGKYPNPLHIYQTSWDPATQTLLVYN